MTHPTYFVLTIFILIILFIIMQSDRKWLDSDNRLTRVQSELMYTMLGFCVVDTFWGILASKVWFNTTMFFIVSTLFHLSVGFISLVWLEFVLEYLYEFIHRKTLYRSVAGILVSTQYLLLVANIWVPTIFSIDEAGDYHLAPLHIYSISIQNVMFVGIAVLAMIGAKRAKSKEKKSHMNAVLLFVLAPIIAGGFQYVFPEYPFHTMGYAIGCITIQAYVIMATKREENDSERVDMRRVLQALTNNYDIICQYNLDTGEEKVYRSNDVFVNDFSTVRQLETFEEKVESYAERYIVPISQKSFIEQMHPDRIWGHVQDGREYVVRHLDYIRSETLWYETRVIRAAGVGLSREILVSYRNVNDEVLEEKKKQREELAREEQLIRISNTDELTGFLNRHAYVETLKEYEDGNLPGSLMIVSFDVNGLKDVNDTLGHSAGDELIKGAANCIRQCFGTYGTVYRVGGDEFIAVLKIQPQNAEILLNDFGQTIISWEGNEVSNLSVAVGYALGIDYPNYSMLQLTELADKRMYENKAKMYEDRGVDRKGKLTALNTLCKVYSKIIRVNLNKNNFSIIQLLPEEREVAEDLNGDYTRFVELLIEKKMIHEGDAGFFKEKMTLDYLVPYFMDNTNMSFYYRRFENGEYVKSFMEILRTQEFTEENMDVFMYVKKMEG